MKYLLDTHVLLWALFEDEKLSDRAEAEISNPKNRIFISIISYWEIALKYGIGKLELNGITPEELVRVSREIGFETLSIGEEEVAAFYRLPKIRHKDPFDRLIIWQAINHKLTLISKDKMIREYKEFGLKFLWK